MNRNEWEFEFTASALASAAKAKKETHQRKMDWWEAKKKETIQKVRDSGIEVKDSVAASYSNTKGNFGPQITIEAGLQRDLSECQDKIMEHNDLVRQYDGWAQVLDANNESRVKLQHDDWLFFFGQ